MYSKFIHICLVTFPNLLPHSLIPGSFCVRRLNLQISLCLKHHWIHLGQCAQVNKTYITKVLSCFRQFNEEMSHFLSLVQPDKKESEESIVLLGACF